jgi:predicted DNA-binding protein (MmcQ/YjbR family)
MKSDANVNKVRSLCLALPETIEIESWGYPTFRAGKKMFAACGKDDEGLTLGLRVGFKRQDELLEDSRFYPTPYAAHLGWVSLHLDGRINWQEVKRLIEEAYRSVALKRMLKALD